MHSFKIAESRTDPDVRDLGKFELMVMLVVAGMAFVGAPYHYAALPGTILLTLSTLHEYAYLQPRFARVGAIRLMAGGVLLAAAMSLGFASLCYAIGRFFAYLIAG